MSLSSISPVKLALNGPILFFAVAVNSVLDFFINFSQPGIAFLRISGLLRASQTFCFSCLIWYDPDNYIRVIKL